MNQLQYFLTNSANKHPDKVAVTFARNTYSFSAVEEESSKLAAYFQSIGVKRGDRVVVMLGNAIESVIAFWAILKAGAVVIPLGTEIKPNKIAYILKDSTPAVLITNESIVTANNEMLGKQNLTRILVPQPSNDFIMDNVESFEAALNGTMKALKPSGGISIDLAAIIYTSGSTGEPKGVMLTHENMLAATRSLNAYLGYKKEDKVLCALPLSFDYGLYQMIMSISTGATLLLEKEFTWPIILLKTIMKEKVTVIPAVPTMVMLLHEQNKLKNVDLSSVRSVTNTGAALTRTNIDMIKNLFPNTKIFSMYGLTECKRCTYLPPEEIDTKPDSVGIAIPNTELWLVDDDNNKITEPDQVGQLVIRGATVMKGYWNKPEKTAEKLKQGWYPGERVLYTGDYCTLDKDGYLYFKGRMDHMIKSRGIKVSPKEVEDFIGAIPEVNSVVVTGVPHKDYGEALFAFVVLDEAGSINEEAIAISCRNGLESYKVPEYISMIPAIPKTPNGKFNVLALKERAVSQVEEQFQNETVG